MTFPTPSRRTPLLLAGLAGLLLGAAFLPLGLGALAWVAFVPLLFALDARVRAGAGLRSLAALGYVFGFVFFLIGLHWIARLSEVAITVPWLKYPAWVAGAAYLAVYPMLATMLAGWLARRTGFGLAMTFPPVWIAIETLRGSGELGFPWFQAGYSQWAMTPVVQMASLGGVTMVTLWIVAVNVLLWRAVAGTARGRAALGLALALIGPWAWGQRVIAAAPRGDGPTVAMVQGNIPGEIKWAGTHQKEILATFLDLSAQAMRATPRPSLVIWPETATGTWMRKQLDQTLHVTAFAARESVGIFSGFADYDYDSLGRPRQRNSAGLFAPDGALGEAYAKRHLVPFGERMPFQWLIPGLGKLDLGQAEWTPGTRAVIFPSAAGPFGCLICFESIFPDLAREEVQRGARWLVVVTNDEWFGRSTALEQHAAMSVFRAIENHVPLARCANTGLTWLIDARGRVVRSAPSFVPAVVAGALAKPGPPTLFTRWGDWPGLLGIAATLALAALALTRRASAS